jgi:lauroyl/myristoyl acyltransferase
VTAGNPLAGAPASAPATPAAEPGGAAPRWYSHPYNRAGFYRLASILAGLPRRQRVALAAALGRLAPRLFPVERAAVRRTLARVTGTTGTRLEQLTGDVFRDFAVCFSDLVTTNRRPASAAPHVATVHGAEWAGERAGGVISLTAHVGNWELAGRLLARHAVRRTHVVVAEEEIRGLERWVRRDGEGVQFVPRSRPTIAVELVAALRRGEAVALQGDRALGTRGDVLVPFFGRPAPFPLGPFLLARAARVPILPAFCLLEPDRRYAVFVLRPLVVRPGEEQAAAGAWVAALEDVVRRHPTQWFNFFDVWDPPARLPGDAR